MKDHRQDKSTNREWDEEGLIDRARAAIQYAYAPYSGYRVGAAVRWESGRITSGGNIENSSYGLTVCAERVALYKGIADGESRPAALAVAVQATVLPVPCGACRQVMTEWANDLPIYLVNGQGEVRRTELLRIFPEAFGADHLESSETRRNPKEEGRT